MARDDLEWLSLMDFTPGIYDKYGSTVTLGKDGAARIDDGLDDPVTGRPKFTYGCYGDPDGSLRPLPRLIRSYTKDLSDVTEPAGFYPNPPTLEGSPPADPTFFVTVPNNVSTFDQHPTTRAIGTGDGGRRTKIGVIDVCQVDGHMSDAWHVDMSLAAGDQFPVYRNLSTKPGQSRPDHIHMITCFRQDPVPVATDPLSMFPRFGRLRSQWRIFFLDQYDPAVGNNLYNYERKWLQKADILEEASQLTGVNVANIPTWIPDNQGNAGTTPPWSNSWWQDSRIIPPATGTGIASGSSYLSYHVMDMAPQCSPHKGWGRGSLAVGRSALGVVNTDDGLSYEDISQPGTRTILGSFQSYTSAQSPIAYFEEWLANFFTVYGGPLFGEAYGAPQSIFMYPNASTQRASAWTNTYVPWHVLEHQDRFVGLIKVDWVTGPPLTPNAIVATRDTMMRHTVTNAVFNGWRNEEGAPTTAAPSTGHLDQAVEIWEVGTKTQGTATLGWSEMMNHSTGLPEAMSDAPKTPLGDFPGNQIRPEGLAFTFQWQNDLVFVPHYGEGSIMRGALEDGAILRTHTIQPAGGVHCVPISTPKGVFYGTADGVALWTGEASDIVSAQLDGGFWICDEASECQSPDGYRWLAGTSFGRFGYLYPFVYAPNNWVMDTRTGGWFRLADPDEPNPYAYMHYVATPRSEMYAVRGCYDNTNTNVMELFSNELPTSEFRWVSQPIMSSINRTLLVERLNLVAQGRGQIDVTLIGIDGTTITETFLVDSPRTAQQIIRPTSMQASDLTVVIESTGRLDPDIDGAEREPAPVVHAVHIGSRTSTELN